MRVSAALCFRVLETCRRLIAGGVNDLNFSGILFELMSTYWSLHVSRMRLSCSVGSWSSIISMVLFVLRGPSAVDRSCTDAARVLRNRLGACTNITLCMMGPSPWDEALPCCVSSRCMMFSFLDKNKKCEWRPPRVCNYNTWSLLNSFLENN